MTIYEFAARTGYLPTEKQFEAIHAEYMAAGDNVDKDTFCKNWKKNGGIEKASADAQREIWALTRDYEEKIQQWQQTHKMITDDLRDQLDEANKKNAILNQNHDKLVEENQRLHDILIQITKLANQELYTE